MKTHLSFLFIFLFLLGFGQEKTDWTSVDSDNDGVIDKDDKCMTVVGKIEYNGCPNKIVEVDCTEKDNRDRIIYNKFSEEKKQINYTGLPNEIIKTISRINDYLQ